MKRNILIVFLIIIFGLSYVSAACDSFYESFNGIESIQYNGGSVLQRAYNGSLIPGELTFEQGMKNNGANFSGNIFVRYNNALFSSQSGSVSFWFSRKNESGNSQGGLFQIGQIGQANSIGIFYTSNSYSYVEMKNSSGYRQASAYNALSETNFTNIIVTWDKRGEVTHFKLFINGKYTSGSSISNVSLPAYAEVGKTGWYGYGKGIIDELRYFNKQLSDPEVYAEYVYSSEKFKNVPTEKPVSTGNVKVIGKQLEVNGKNFIVKGVGYQPVPIGKSNDATTLNSIYSNSKILSRDMKLLRDMNANTIRLWANLNNSILLDALYNNGTQPIYAIMSFEVPVNLNYADNATIINLENSFRDYVNKFKNHPGVLAWAIGNENNLHYHGNISDWYILANRLAKVAYETEGESYHPTMLINGYLLYFGDVDYKSDDVSLNYVDIWGHNSYTGYSFGCYFDFYNKISSKPLVLTEFGVDALNYSSHQTYEDVQADWEVNQWREIVNNSAGGTVMAYSDEYWKGGWPSGQLEGGYYTDVQPDGYSNEAWWGLFSIAKNGTSIDILTPRQAYFALKSEFSKDLPTCLSADFNFDGKVDISDLSILGGNWNGVNKTRADGDANGDFRVDISDLSILGGNWNSDIGNCNFEGSLLMQTTQTEQVIEQIVLSNLSSGNFTDNRTIPATPVVNNIENNLLPVVIQSASIPVLHSSKKQTKVKSTQLKTAKKTTVVPALVTPVKNPVIKLNSKKLNVIRLN